jgi:adenine-specific DNA methylase
MRASRRYRLRFTGVELLPEEARKARSVAKGDQNMVSDIVSGDFLEWAQKKLDSGAQFDAVVGNPPYIRYQYLAPKDQVLSETIFARYGLDFTKHTNAWVPFVIASVGLLAPGGRLAMVIPSEILHVLHAGSLRKFLLTECSRILMVDPSELLFDEALQGTVLLMLEKKGSPDEVSEGVCILPMSDNEFLRKDPAPLFADALYVSGDVLNGKWMKVLLSAYELQVYEKVRRMRTIRRFGDVASVDVGIVTGANKFFLVDDAIVARFGLEDFIKPMFGRSDHCQGIVYDNHVHKANRARGLPTNLVMFGDVPFTKLPSGAKRYVKYGEEQGLHNRYKCRIRKPWYSVPSIYSTPVGMLKRSHNFPRLILNSSGAYTTDTAYRIRTIGKSVSAEALVYAFVNSLTALSAELEGRHYGGGVLELVPSEIEKLAVPIVEPERIELKALDQRVRKRGDPRSLLAAQDEIVLKAAGLTKKERETIREAWCRIRSRRQRLIPEE